MAHYGAQRRSIMRESETENTKASEIASRIREARKLLGYSYADLGKLAQISKSTLQRYEKGAIQEISIIKLFDIAKALQVSVHYLIGLSMDPDINELWAKPIIKAYAKAIKPIQKVFFAPL